MTSNSNIKKHTHHSHGRRGHDGGDLGGTSAMGGDNDVPAPTLDELRDALGSGITAAQARGDGDALDRLFALGRVLAVAGRAVDQIEQIADGRVGGDLVGQMVNLTHPIRQHMRPEDETFTRPHWLRAEDADATHSIDDCVDDDPERLRAGGPVEVGSALWDVATYAASAPSRRTREAAALLREHLHDGHRHDTFDLDLGLRRRDGRPGLSLASKRVERDELLLRLSRLDPFSAMGSWTTARAVREALSEYATRRWPREKPPHRKAAPPMEPNATFWRVLRLGLPQGPAPRQDDLAALIEADRADHP